MVIVYSDVYLLKVACSTTHFTSFAAYASKKIIERTNGEVLALCYDRGGATTT